ncbi:hypothetical protein FKW77_006784 [Venturia effusa]|uniref:FCP1 homology domain-containing protein n=1 Tax=Venturia effusa TaxID=50376 RepID=A0A517LLN2_9PEZI|nr:hypothetical protein FKW77_006784 [Venturia effusa]
MNSLNFISGRSPTPPYSDSRRSSYAGLDIAGINTTSQLLDKKVMIEAGADDERQDPISTMAFTESTPLLAHQNPDHFGQVKTNSWRSFPKRVTTAIIGTTHVIIHTITLPARYVIAYFYDDEGHFHPFLPFLTICRVLSSRKRRRVAEPFSSSEKPDNESGRTSGDGNGSKRRTRRPSSIASATSAVVSDSDMDEKRGRAGPSRHSRSKSLASDADEIAPQRRSIRIKLHNEDALKKRRKQQEDARARAAMDPSDEKEALAMSLKSPNSPGHSKLKFPRAPVPPRPLVPRRQPSYSKLITTGPRTQKTLVIDLDETLIHSQAKGGRFSTGHMVEVKIQNTMAGGGPFGPQVPILYYVHKRPNCDEFLRKVSKWYNLVVFTASVQEYADPVTDWLELERSYFSARYYRQHCTLRNGAYIKDLSQVEPDLSKVAILDNSPVSYVFHEDNAIPIEGWISDPTDNDLLQLIPLLEGLAHCTDVRAVLSLRRGQPQLEG